AGGGHDRERRPEEQRVSRVEVVLLPARQLDDERDHQERRGEEDGDREVLRAPPPAIDENQRETARKRPVEDVVSEREEAQRLIERAPGVQRRVVGTAVARAELGPPEVES